MGENLGEREQDEPAGALSRPDGFTPVPADLFLSDTPHEKSPGGETGGCEGQRQRPSEISRAIAARAFVITSSPHRLM
jgi:hypothetical protein